jgi:hypothetical protein
MKNCDFALDVERQPLFRAPGHEVHVAAHRPEEILAAAKQHVFRPREDASLDQLLRLAHAVDVFCDPEQRVEVAKPALAVLHIGLDQVARLPGAAVTLLAFGELRGDELRRGALRDVLVEAGDQLVEQLPISEQEARLENGGANRHVGLGLADALVDRARGVADLQPQIPEAIQDCLGDRFAPGGLLVGQDEQQIDVGAGCQQAAPIAAGGDDRHTLFFGAVLRGIEVLLRELEQHADDLVVHEAQAFRAAAAVPVAEQHLLGLGAPFHERGFQALDDRAAQLALVTAVALAHPVEIGGKRRRVEQRGGPARGLVGRGEHGGNPIADRGRRVTPCRSPHVGHPYVV